MFNFVSMLGCVFKVMEHFKKKHLCHVFHDQTFLQLSSWPEFLYSHSIVYQLIIQTYFHILKAIDQGQSC